MSWLTEGERKSWSERLEIGTKGVGCVSDFMKLTEHKGRGDTSSSLCHLMFYCLSHGAAISIRFSEK